MRASGSGWRAISAAAPATRTSSRRSSPRPTRCGATPPRPGEGVTAVAQTAERYVGSEVRRKEDAELITGDAKYTDDLSVPGMLWMHVVRSPFAHARIKSVDVSKALAMEGVVAAFSGQDIEWAGPLLMAWPVAEGIHNPPHWPLAKDKARYQGDGVAVVVAEP